MFGLRLIHKRELALYAAEIGDLRKEVERWRALVEHERKRAEGAINALLIHVAKVAITSDNAQPSVEEQEKAIERQLDIFGDGQTMNDAEALEKLQS